MRSLDKIKPAALKKGMLEDIEKRKNRLSNGWYPQENLPLQGYYTTLAMDYAEVARYQTLLQEPLSEIQQHFKLAGQQILKSFTMAYDPNDPDYLGSEPPKEPGNPGYGEFAQTHVNEVEFFTGMNYALMAQDFDLARSLSYWYRLPPSGYKMDDDVSNYAFGYKYCVLDDTEKAQPILQENLDQALKRKPTHPADVNYFTLSMTVQGIVMRSNKLFNEGLQHQLDFYEKHMTPAHDGWDTSEEGMCDHAVAFANLALHYGLSLQVEHELMPESLLLQR